MKENAHKVLDVYKLSPEEEAMLASSSAMLALLP